MKSFFISSTFKDMQAERDILHYKVFPRLQKKLASCGDSVQELDLRWGVDTSTMNEEESGRCVVRTCVDAIDRCHPYMIILLGERYGWIPDDGMIEQVHDDRILPWYERGSSITQLEIVYGALGDKAQRSRCIFCFRDPSVNDTIPAEKRSLYDAESPIHAQKLLALKEKILSFDDVSLLHYSASWNEESGKLEGFDQFEAQLEAVLYEMLKKDLSDDANLSPEEKILRDSTNTRDRLLATYVSRPESEKQLANAQFRPEPTWLVSSGGMGKSCLMAETAVHAEAYGVHVFSYFAGNPGCEDTAVLAATLNYWVSKEWGATYSGGIDWRSALINIELGIRAADKFDKTCSRMILIDGVDQMDDNVWTFLELLAQSLPEKQKKGYSWTLIISSREKLPDNPFIQALQKRFYIQKLSRLEPTELDMIAQKHAAFRGKKIDGAVCACIRGKRNADIPYYLSLMLQRLFMLDQHDFELADAIAPGMEGLSQYMQRLLYQIPDEPEETIAYTLNQAAEHLAASIGKYSGSDMDLTAQAHRIFRYLALSHRGLTPAELGGVFEMTGERITPAFVETLLFYLYDTFQENRDGRFVFRHRLMRETILHAMQPEEKQDMLRTLQRFLIREHGSTLSEQIYYAWKADIPDLFDTISKNDADDLFYTKNIILQIAVEDKSGWLLRFFEKLPEIALAYYYRLFVMFPEDAFSHSGSMRPLAFLNREIADDCRCWQSLLKLTFLLEELDNKQLKQTYGETASLLAKIADPQPYAQEFFRLSKMLFFRYSGMRSVVAEAVSRNLQAIRMEQLRTHGPESSFATIYENEPHVATVDTELEILKGFEAARTASDTDKIADYNRLCDRINAPGTMLYSGDRHLYLAMLSKEMLRTGKYHAVYELCSEQMRHFGTHFQFSRNYSDGDIYTTLLNVLARCVSDEFRVKHLQNAAKKLEELTALYPTIRLFGRLAEVYVNLAEAEEKYPSRGQETHDLAILSYYEKSEKYCRKICGGIPFSEFPALQADTVLGSLFPKMKYLCASCHILEKQKEIEALLNELNEQCGQLYSHTKDDWYLDYQGAVCANGVAYYAALRDYAALSDWAGQFEASVRMKFPGKNDADRFARYKNSKYLAEQAFRAGASDLAETFLNRMARERAGLSDAWILKHKKSRFLKASDLQIDYMRAELHPENGPEIGELFRRMRELTKIQDNQLYGLKEEIYLGIVRLEIQMLCRAGDLKTASTLLGEAMRLKLPLQRPKIPSVENQFLQYRLLELEEQYAVCCRSRMILEKILGKYEAVYEYPETLASPFTKTMPYYFCFSQAIAEKRERYPICEKSAEKQEMSKEAQIMQAAEAILKKYPYADKNSAALSTDEISAVYSASRIADTDADQLRYFRIFYQAQRTAADQMGKNGKMSDRSAWYIRLASTALQRVELLESTDLTYMIGLCENVRKLYRSYVNEAAAKVCRGVSTQGSSGIAADPVRYSALGELIDTTGRLYLTLYDRIADGSVLEKLLEATKDLREILPLLKEGFILYKKGSGQIEADWHIKEIILASYDYDRQALLQLMQQAEQGGEKTSDTIDIYLHRYLALIPEIVEKMPAVASALQHKLQQTLLAELYALLAAHKDYYKDIQLMIDRVVNAGMTTAKNDPEYLIKLAYSELGTDATDAQVMDFIKSKKGNS